MVLKRMNRIFVFFIGIIMALLFLETGLRVGSLVYMWRQDSLSSSVATGQGQKYVVLCLGNSYTKGDGAPLSMSYPAQLQIIFDEKMPQRNIKVINKGRGGQNTSELLDDLIVNLEKFKPDLVVLQTGQANLWNYLQYTKYLGKNDKHMTLLRRWAYFGSECLHASRVYRLWLLLGENLKQMKDGDGGVLTENADGYRISRAYLEAVDFIREMNTAFSNRVPVVLDEARVAQVLSVLMGAIKTDPGYSDNYVLVGHIYRFQEKYEEALRWFMASVDVDIRGRRGEDLHRGYREIRNMRKMDKGPGQERLNRKIDDYIRQFNAVHPEAAVNLYILSDAQIEQWVEADINEMVRIIRGHGAALILQDYPIDTPSNEILKRIAEEWHVPLVNNREVFQEKMKAGMVFKDLYSVDGHCNARGYGVMAENVYNKIVETVFDPSRLAIE
ncbi:MAG: hypothetical protein V2A70_04595 [Candidatus Omnitrophota bacterium]